MLRSFTSSGWDFTQDDIRKETRLLWSLDPKGPLWGNDKTDISHPSRDFIPSPLGQGRIYPLLTEEGRSRYTLTGRFVAYNKQFFILNSSFFIRFYEPSEEFFEGGFGAGSATGF